MVGLGGGGGGAVQLVSLSDIEIASSGGIDVGGGGGDYKGGGGGSGGHILLEAAKVLIGRLVVGNGAAGGGCNAYGTDGRTDGAVATGPGPCGDPRNYGYAGSGGTTTVPPTDGHSGFNYANVVGGGGAVGRMRVATLGGDFEVVGSPVIGVAIEKMTLNPR